MLDIDIHFISFEIFGFLTIIITAMLPKAQILYIKMVKFQQPIKGFIK